MSSELSDKDDLARLDSFIKCAEACERYVDMAMVSIITRIIIIVL